MIFCDPILRILPSLLPNTHLWPSPELFGRCIPVAVLCIIQNKNPRGSTQAPFGGSRQFHIYQIASCEVLIAPRASGHSSTQGSDSLPLKFSKLKQLDISRGMEQSILSPGCARVEQLFSSWVLPVQDILLWALQNEERKSNSMVLPPGSQAGGIGQKGPF